MYFLVFVFFSFLVKFFLTKKGRGWSTIVILFMLIASFWQLFCFFFSFNFLGRSWVLIYFICWWFDHSKYLQDILLMYVKPFYFMMLILLKWYMIVWTLPNIRDFWLKKDLFRYYKGVSGYFYVLRFSPISMARIHISHLIAKNFFGGLIRKNKKIQILNFRASKAARWRS